MRNKNILILGAKVKFCHANFELNRALAEACNARETFMHS